MIDAQLSNRPRLIGVLTSVLFDTFQKIARLCSSSAVVSCYFTLTDLRSILLSNCSSLLNNRSSSLTPSQKRRQCQQRQEICSDDASNFAERFRRLSIDPMNSVVVSSFAGQPDLRGNLRYLQYARALEVTLLQMDVEV
jgi:hypothetical protein